MTSIEIRRAAYKVYSAALRSGALVRKPCRVCGNPRSHGHHPNYNRPLAVRWLCAEHHGARHEKKWRSRKPGVAVPGCALEPCPKAAKVAGLCWMHYQRQRRAKKRAS